MTSPRDYSSISPSAKSILLLKAGTALPYARQAAELLFGPEALAALHDSSPYAAARRAHFDERARSLDEALRQETSTIILELAAGLSFRGLAMVEARGVTYLDTDLPGMSALKAELIPRLPHAPRVGTLRVEPLNALDAEAFRSKVASLPPGPISVIHEGLMMYLGPEEKARLATSVREALLERGGAWITADVYVRAPTRFAEDERSAKFRADHRIEENKFAGWAEAQAFFESNGFEIARRLAPLGGGIRETWTLHARR
jgi:O-methyltransferase involved in polyketide biosynthesis